MVLGRLIEKVADYCGFASNEMQETSNKCLNAHLERNFLGAVPLKVTCPIKAMYLALVYFLMMTVLLVF
ncbi:hypothetical protein [Rickettsia asiatica]|uniref:hypothetical protein n=1 Tax=Rickettsia asiatica TaxID=238800 RepID=UPI0011BD9D60|nr:hypothetical protein [Rickettsia asiatica]